MDNSTAKKTVTELDVVARETGLGEFIVKYRVAFITFVGLLMLSVVGYGLYSKYKASVASEMDKIIFDYTKSSLQDFKDGKSDADKLVGSFNALQEKIKNYDGGIAITAETADLLVEKNNLDQALLIAKRGHEKYAKNNAYTNYFLSVRLAAIYEDLGKTAEAISLLEGLQTSAVKLLESKTYLDLGRLYYNIGNMEKAKVNLEYLVGHFNQDEFAKVGKLILDEINKKAVK
ncbi:MAG: hypothetical protein A2504_15865 [Bdellovibrionales bacterium RIFOXYD12_FULL_39_22]|nr:MAG: hypothetical protein A2385_07775 [Bdellovibrionales bacterium RIFOXYB1_FULL_39_21]OFZ43042.1 MAG: hypothetical protein A2485_11450 [Bdellovibrionales bacterium RIFOXYC12_FULL_39_17]OFZ50872.1 MAG: hypothetical protein A2404_06690 [Bdellovibrionales bacterium RIFOXYC1_FULL_39_130]OFZ71373.1 MAG: hypothetical protein A2451_16265 [Bdellovibrionales bacterium RIFOXYC2_FULL_39_8]OFZ78095.1 MAG: hypothetical protein A2560_01860 [Bdellovibrionales bacterium RIFOXYD1_FULL_39_84]OFZ93963.1 MAG: